MHVSYDTQLFPLSPGSPEVICPAAQLTGDTAAGDLGSWSSTSRADSSNSSPRMESKGQGEMSSRDYLDLQVVKEADQVTRWPMHISVSMILVISTLPIYMPVHGFQAFSHVQSTSTLFCFASSCKPPFQTGALGPTCPYFTPRCQGSQVQGQGVVGVPRSSDPKCRAHTAARVWPDDTSSSASGAPPLR